MANSSARCWTHEVVGKDLIISQIYHDEKKTLTVPTNKLAKDFLKDIDNECGGCNDLPTNGYNSEKYAWCQLSRQVANLHDAGYKFKANTENMIKVDPVELSDLEDASSDLQVLAAITGIELIDLKRRIAKTAKSQGLNQSECYGFLSAVFAPPKKMYLFATLNDNKVFTSLKPKQIDEVSSAVLSRVGTRGTTERYSEWFDEGEYEFSVDIVNAGISSVVPHGYIPFEDVYNFANGNMLVKMIIAPNERVDK